jgi:hypothetical protein
MIPLGGCRTVLRRLGPVKKDPAFLGQSVGGTTDSFTDAVVDPTRVLADSRIDTRKVRVTASFQTKQSTCSPVTLSSNGPQNLHVTVGQGMTGTSFFG